MARILYGVHGTGHGHAVRAMTVARLCPEHDYLFISHGDGLRLIQDRFSVQEMPNPVTPVTGHRVNLPRLALANVRFRLQAQWHEDAVMRLAEDFQPDIGMSDYEYFVPRVCRRRGIPCLSIDNQHVITRCVHRLPWWRRPEYWATAHAVEGWFGMSSGHVISSFYRPPLRPSFGDTTVIPPILREGALLRTSQDRGHVLAYQGYATFSGFMKMLRKIDRKVRIYGMGPAREEGNCEFRSPSEEGLLDDLAGCSYVICGGGHTLISEALFLGKPVLSFPIAIAFEQYLNAFYLERLGYGMRATLRQAGPRLIAAFDEKLPDHRRNIAAGDFNGNGALQAYLKTRLT